MNGFYGQDTMSLYEENLLNIIEGFFSEIDNDIISENVEAVNEMKLKKPLSEKIHKLIEKIKEFIKRMLLRIKAILRMISTGATLLRTYIKYKNNHVIVSHSIIDKPDMLDASKVFKDFDPEDYPTDQEEVINKLNKTYKVNEYGAMKHELIFILKVAHFKVVDFGKYNTEEEKKELKEKAEKFIKDNKTIDTINTILDNNEKYIESLEKSITKLKQEISNRDKDDPKFYLEKDVARLKNTLYVLRIVNELDDMTYLIAKGENMQAKE